MIARHNTSINEPLPSNAKQYSTYSVQMNHPLNKHMNHTEKKKPRGDEYVHSCKKGKK